MQSPDTLLRRQDARKENVEEIILQDIKQLHGGGEKFNFSCRFDGKDKLITGDIDVKSSMETDNKSVHDMLFTCQH